ncbi:MAG: 1-deoxy-D-xylulose-5-phosphate synthase N-terminal domain-containing protein, partial [Phycisphaerae bacterium]
VLNDNKWGIAPTQGAFAQELARFRASQIYEDIKQRTRKLLPKVPVVGKPVYGVLDHLKEGIKATVSPDQIFEQLGFQYIGPIDGHDIDHLIEMLELIKDVHHPILLHVHTVKGRGCDWASADPGKFHSPKPFVVQNGKVTVTSGQGKSWTRAFVEALIDQARNDPRIYALTAAMPDGTGLDKFAEVFPERCLDAGIAESCTTDIAAGMARAGLRPVVAIYSTFLQRAFDQVFQEVVLQGLPVLFCLDRAGLVGGDGAVHHGFLDITFLRAFPGMVLMAPADEAELRAAMQFALTLDGPAAIRYPRDAVPSPLPGPCPSFAPGVAREVRSGDAGTLLCYGTTVAPALDAAELLAEQGSEIRVINARFARPIDRAMVAEVFSDAKPVMTAEDHSIAGGFGSAVLETVQELGLSAANMVRLGIPPDRFIAHGPRAGQLAEVGLDATGMAAAMTRLLDDAGRADLAARPVQAGPRPVVPG